MLESLSKKVEIAYKNTYMGTHEKDKFTDTTAKFK